MKKFTIEITTGPVELDVSEIWPNGDAPENPTAQNVLDLVLCEGLLRVLREWNFDSDLEAIVTDRELKKTVSGG